MKKLHLICNSHLDPVWQWDWNEGIAATLATFYQAAKFCDEYDYIFCHGESILYEWVEKYDKPLFEKITDLIKAGKWHIMGGWYIQPDCNAPSGESFVRQIKLGQSYFKKKFGVTPRVAINMDSFGHSIGLVQILKKTGYEGYLICRPEKHDQKEDIRQAIWRGKDGSEIKLARAEDQTIYCSMFGNALNDVNRKASNYEDLEVGVALWGVGNHGGVNSKIDLENIEKLIKESEKVEILHSTPEKYFADIHPTNVVEYSLQPKLKGSYSSLSSIKRVCCELENALDRTQRITSVASANGLIKYDEEKFIEVEKALASVQFHDILSGTCCQDGERSSLNIAHGALSKLYDLYNESFFTLIREEIKAVPGEYPILIYNHQPYDRKALCEVEILIERPLDSETEEYLVDVKKDGKVIASQCIKELGNINFDRRKRIAFFCDLKALDIARVDFEIKMVSKRPVKTIEGELVISDSVKTLKISRETGLLESYVVNGKEVLSGGAFMPMIGVSTPNPWGHFLDKIDSDLQPIPLSTCEKGPFEGYKNVRVTECGDVLTRVESLFEKGDSFVRISYIIPKDMPYIDVDLDVFWNEQNKSLRLKVPASFDGKLIAQTAFAVDELAKDSFDNPTQRFTAMVDGDSALAVYNDGVYDCSAENNEMYLLLLNGAAYCAHLVGEKPIIKEKDRYIDYIEQGKHHFSFRFAYDKLSELETKTDEFLNKPFCLNAYPHGSGKTDKKVVVIDNPCVTLKGMFEYEGETILHILNNGGEKQSASVDVFGKKIALDFKPYEVKTLVYNGEVIERTELL